MTKHYDQDSACYEKERLTIRQESAIDLDMSVAYWLAYAIPGAIAGGLVLFLLSSVVACVRF